MDFEDISYFPNFHIFYNFHTLVKSDKPRMFLIFLVFFFYKSPSKITKYTDIYNFSCSF